MQLRLNELVAQVRQEQGVAADSGGPLPVTYRQAVNWLARPAYLKSARYRAQTWSANLSGLDLEVREFVRQFIRSMAKLNIPTHCSVGFVSRADQARLYVLGHSPLRPGECPHNSGLAVVLVSSIQGRELPPLAVDLFEHVGSEVNRKLSLDMVFDRTRLRWVSARVGH